jgi:hypothetical protein
MQIGSNRWVRETERERYHNQDKGGRTIVTEYVPDAAQGRHHGEVDHGFGSTREDEAVNR